VGWGVGGGVGVWVRVGVRVRVRVRVGFRVRVRVGVRVTHGSELWRGPAGSALDDARAPASRIVGSRHVLVAGARAVGEDGELACSGPGSGSG
jgi:hypothetical protein